MKTAWTAAAAIALVSVSAAAGAQSLVDAAKRAEDSRKTSSGVPLIFDARDVDPKAAAHEIFGYEITEERWKKFLAANKLINAVMVNDQALFARFQALRINSARMIERFYLREPALLKVLEATGTNAHDQAYTAVATGVAIAVIAADPGPAVFEQLSDTTKVNVAFVRAHIDEAQDLLAMVQEKIAQRTQ